VLLSLLVYTQLQRHAVLCCLGFLWWHQVLLLLLLLLPVLLLLLLLLPVLLLLPGLRGQLLWLVVWLQLLTRPMTCCRVPLLRPLLQALAVMLLCGCTLRVACGCP